MLVCYTCEIPVASTAITVKCFVTSLIIKGVISELLERTLVSFHKIDDLTSLKLNHNYMSEISKCNTGISFLLHNIQQL